MDYKASFAQQAPTDRGTRERRSSGTTDLLRLYLQDIGRIDLLTNEEEVTLARLVQRREALLRQQRIWPKAIQPSNYPSEELQRREAANSAAHKRNGRRPDCPCRSYSSELTLDIRSGLNRPNLRPKI